MNTRVAEVCSDLKKVPPFPAAAAKLLSLLSGKVVDTHELAELIANDAALTARLLREANSARYGRHVSRSDIRSSIELIGLDRMRELTVIYGTASYGLRSPNNLEMKRCWEHSLATAVLADRIASTCGSFTSMAFTAGILHDIGRLGLMVAFPRQYTRAVRGAAGRYLDLLDFEQDEFGMSHAEAGRFMAEAWNLPEEFRMIAGRHHDSCDGTELNLLYIIHSACKVADALGFSVLPSASEGDVETILDTLPGRAGKNHYGSAPELRADVEERMSANR